jgi:hypothetical protein
MCFGGPGTALKVLPMAPDVQGKDVACCLQMASCAWIEPDTRALVFIQTVHPMQHHAATESCELWDAFGVKSTFENFRTVEAQPKFALVDTFSHASCENRQNVGKQCTFPTT